MKGVITSTFSHQLLMSVGRDRAEDDNEMKQTYCTPSQYSPLRRRGPHAGTMLPSVRPSNRIGSVLGPALYANVQSAHAACVGKPSSMRLRPEFSQSVRSGSILLTTQQRSARGVRPSHTSERHAKVARLNLAFFILIDIYFVVVVVFMLGTVFNFPDGTSM